MTNREFYATIANTANVTEELRAYAAEQVAKLDERNSKRNSKPTKKQEENAPIKAAIMEYLAEHTTADSPLTSPDIGAALDLTHNKVGGILRVALAANEVAQVEIKVKGKGKMKAWYIPTEEMGE